MWQGVNPWIEVDGGVSPANAYQLIEVGANALVAGSAVFGAKDYAEGESSHPVLQSEIRCSLGTQAVLCGIIHHMYVCMRYVYGPKPTLQS